jgi:hypothetical protein
MKSTDDYDTLVIYCIIAFSVLCTLLYHVMYLLFEPPSMTESCTPHNEDSKGMQCV